MAAHYLFLSDENEKWPIMSAWVAFVDSAAPRWTVKLF